MFLIPLIAIWAVILITNFSFSAWISGWDNLHPEFNFGLNIQRSLFAVWQEYQGLGLLGGMGHASDLVRQLFLGFISPILPEYLLRQVYLFLMLITGPVGVYFLLNKILLKDLPEKTRKLSSLAGSLSYLLNLATIQTFYLPFSSFTHHFAFLPWLIYSVLNYFKNPGKKSMIILAVINLLATPQSYVPTIFVVYFIVLLMILGYEIFSKRTLDQFRKASKVLLITLLINAFWLLPFVYFTFTNTSVAFSSKINQLATEEVFLRNKQYGNLADVLLLKGFWFENTDFLIAEDRYEYVLTGWREHLKKPATLIAGFSVVAVIFWGLISSFTKKRKYRWLLLFLFLFPFTILANNTPVFKIIDEFIYKLPLVAQAFRFPYTKMSLLAGLIYSLLFAFGIADLLERMTKYLKQKTLHGLFFIWIVLTLGAFTFPVFQGKLFYPQTKADIPQKYFQTFEFLNRPENKGRIANLPQNNFWGWSFYDWGYSGSGFIWYGIESPVLDRAFDVWSREGENYYWELSYALSIKDKALVESVLNKYQIKWVMIDESLVNVYGNNVNYLEVINSLTENNGSLKLVKTIGKIKLYEVNAYKKVDNFVYVTGELPNVNSKNQWNNIDNFYHLNGEYKTTGNLNSEGKSYYYPFASLFTGKNQDDIQLEIEEIDDYILFRSRLPDGIENYDIKIPEFNNNELVWVDTEGLTQVAYYSPRIQSDGMNLEIVVPKSYGYFGTKLDVFNIPGLDKPQECDQLNSDSGIKTGELSNKVVEEGGFKMLRLYSKNTKNCSASYWLPNLSHKYAYMVSILAKNNEGKTLRFWVENLSTKKTEMESYLPENKDLKFSRFIIPPLQEDGLGYSLHIDNVSIGDFPSSNDLYQLAIFPIPYEYLSQIYFEKGDSNNLQYFEDFSVVHPNPSLYKVNITNPEGKTLVLSQSFDKGWMAFNMTGLKLNLITDHFKINNWSNGWNINGLKNNSEIIIFYVPQLLEFAGFIFLGWGFGFIFLEKTKRH